MSVTLSVTQVFSATLADGTKFDLGELYTPQTITLTLGTKFETLDVIADNYGEDVLWTSGEGGMDTFEVLLLYSSADIWLEFRTDNATPQYIPHLFQGGIWHVLSSDDLNGGTSSVFDGAVLVEGTDYDQINQIEAHNDAADNAGDANVHLVLLG